MKSKNKFSVLCVSLMFLISGFSQNNALNFDGVDDYVNLNSIAPLIENATNFTIEFWMNADALEQSQERVVLFSVNRPAPAGGNEFLIIMGETGTVQEGKLIIYDQNLMSGGGAPTNFEEVNNIENSVSIYPNPSNGGFNIEMQGDKQKFTLFEVYDTKGSLVLSKKIDNVLTTIYYNEIGITGVYYVRFMTNDRKNQLVKKVIVD